jgi:catechol 2,3-dioxygenase-like lactoylglutathione lyase family enzyme
MTVKAGYSTPMLHVADIPRSIRFYELLGFGTVDTEGPADCPFWARLHCEGGAIMLLSADAPVDPSVQAVLLYMYTPDLAGLRDQLVASGVAAPPIRHPEHMPSGELHLHDPDGYTVLVAHWGDSEHQAWLERIGKQRPPS